MNVSANEFRQALSRFSSGVTVVTGLSPDGTPVGVTVSAFSSVSLVPPLILICLDKTTTNLDVFTKGQKFAVNILAAGQEDVSNAFAFPGPVAPFERFPNINQGEGAPVLNGVLANLQCTREAVYPGGDHEIILGRVESADWSDNGMPLLYAAGGYRILAPSPDAA